MFANTEYLLWQVGSSHFRAVGGQLKSLAVRILKTLQEKVQHSQQT